MQAPISEGIVPAISFSSIKKTRRRDNDLIRQSSATNDYTGLIQRHQAYLNPALLRTSTSRSQRVLNLPSHFGLLQETQGEKFRRQIRSDRCKQATNSEDMFFFQDEASLTQLQVR